MSDSVHILEERKIKLAKEMQHNHDMIADILQKGSWEDFHRISPLIQGIRNRAVEITKLDLQLDKRTTAINRHIERILKRAIELERSE